MGPVRRMWARMYQPPMDSTLLVETGDSGASDPDNVWPSRTGHVTWMQPSGLYGPFAVFGGVRRLPAEPASLQNDLFSYDLRIDAQQLTDEMQQASGSAEAIQSAVLDAMTRMALDDQGEIDTETRVSLMLQAAQSMNSTIYTNSSVDTARILLNTTASIATVDIAALVPNVRDPMLTMMDRSLQSLSTLSEQELRELIISLNSFLDANEQEGEPSDATERTLRRDTADRTLALIERALRLYWLQFGVGIDVRFALTDNPTAPNLFGIRNTRANLWSQTYPIDDVDVTFSGQPPSTVPDVLLGIQAVRYNNFPFGLDTPRTAVVAVEVFNTVTKAFETLQDLTDPVVVRVPNTLGLTSIDARDSNGRAVACSWWDADANNGAGAWSQSGGTVLSVDANFIECAFVHLTSFGATLTTEETTTEEDNSGGGGGGTTTLIIAIVVPVAVCCAAVLVVAVIVVLVAVGFGARAKVVTIGKSEEGLL